MRKARCLCIALFLGYLSGASSLWAQMGNPFIASPELPQGISTLNFSIEQDSEGVMLFANRQGLLVYDGIEWKYPKIPVSPTRIYMEPATGEVYAGAAGSYGKLVKPRGQPYRYEEISGDFSEIGTIAHIQSNEEHIYFLSSNTLSMVGIGDPSEKKIWRAGGEDIFDGLLVYDEGCMVHIRNRGFFRPVADSLVRAGEFPQFQDSNPVCIFPCPEGEWAVCTDGNGIFFFDGTDFRQFKPEDQEYLENHLISTGLSLPSGELAIGTYTGGCIVIDRNTGETRYLFNYHTGLPEDEIMVMGTDRNRGLWLAQEYGLSRVDFSFPVRNFNIYPGLQGNLLTVSEKEGVLFAGSSEGVFYLDEIREYREVEVWVREGTHPPVTAEPSPGVSGKESVEESPELPRQGIAESDTATAAGRERPGFFRRLFGKKEKEKEEEARPGKQAEKVKQQIKEPETLAPGPIQTAAPRPRYVRKKISTLESVRHEFAAVKGLNAKSRQLVQKDGILLAATNIGVYELFNESAEPVIENINIRFLVPSVRKNHFFAAGSAGLVVLRKDPDGWWKHIWDEDFGEVVSIYEEDPRTLWIGAENRAFRVSLGNSPIPVSVERFELQNERTYPVVVRGINRETFIFSADKIYTYDSDKNQLVTALEKLPEISSVPHLIWNQQGVTWLKTDQSWQLIEAPASPEPEMIRYLWLFENIRDIYLSASGEFWVLHGENRLSKVLPQPDRAGEIPFNIHFTGLSHALGEQEVAGYQEISHEQFPVNIHVTAPYFVKPENTIYQYRMDPFMKDWSKWSPQYSTITFHNLPPGIYTLYVRARNIMGNTSDIRSARFEIHPPFYREAWFIVLASLGGALLVSLLVWLWTRKLQHDKKVLEERVEERTREITQQKEEIESQRDELGKQRDQIALQKKEITDSILYASRIQSAILPPYDQIVKSFREHFIIYIPRDIVSGDFYWFREQGGKILVAAADCTGHGVPGAFMSMLGLTALNDIAVNTRISKAGLILDELRNRIITALHQTGKADEAKDGLDIALCIIDEEKMKIQFAGAFNPLFHFREGRLNEIKGDKMPIGIYDKGLKPFTNHTIDCLKGDTLYLFSDGFIDQFGGKDEKKFKSQRFRELLERIQGNPLPRQKDLLEEAFLGWKGTLEQVDDILVIGIRL